MAQQQAVSLQKKLVKSSVLSSVLAGILALSILLGISTYQSMQLQDEIMDEISDMLLVSDVTNQSGIQIDELSEEFEIQYQLLLNHVLLTSSENSDFPKEIAKNYQYQQGYDLIWFDQQLWRSYVDYDQQGELSTFLMQPLSYRFSGVLESVLLYIAVLLILWLLQWGIVHVAINRQFKSLHRLSRQIAEKNAQDLHPIKQDNIEFQELQPMVDQLNKMLLRVEQALVSEQRFTADASHELRSPLSAIQMRLQVLKRKYNQDTQLHQSIADIQKDVERGTQILENLLLLARLDPTLAEQLPKQAIDIKVLITDVLQIVKPLAEPKNIIWQFKLQSIMVQVNIELLSSCIRNLLDNAIRYQHDQGNIHISTQQYHHMIEILIEDDGQQLDDNVLTRMGERFYRALGTKTQGSGLGLSICKKIIELHHGEIQFSRSDLGGLLVRIQLPHSI